MIRLPPLSYEMKKYHFISDVIIEYQSPLVWCCSEPKTSKEEGSAALVPVVCGTALSQVASEAEALFHSLALAKIVSFSLFSASQAVVHEKRS